MGTRFTSSLYFLLTLMCTVLAFVLPAQSNQQWQFHSGWARFIPDNEYNKQVVDGLGNLSLVNGDFPILNGLAVGLGYQRSLRPKVALEASWFYTQCKKDFTELYWGMQAQGGRDLSDIATTTPHTLQLTWLNVQTFYQQHWQKGIVLEIGVGLGAAWFYQHYRSGFSYNEFLEQMESEEYTRKRTWAVHLPITIRSSFPVTERWMVGIEASAMAFFKEAQMLDFLAVSAHYKIEP